MLGTDCSLDVPAPCRGMPDADLRPVDAMHLWHPPALIKSRVASLAACMSTLSELATRMKRALTGCFTSTIYHCPAKAHSGLGACGPKQ